MRKRFLLFGLLFLLMFCFGIRNISVANNSKLPSQYRIGVSYSNAVYSEKPALVLFYADWCGYCKRFMPVFESLYRLYGTKYNFSMVNTDLNRALAAQMGVKGFPSVYIIDRKNKQKFLIPPNYYSDVNAFSTILNNYLKKRQK